MKKLAMSAAGALLAGLFVTAPAQAGCTPIHDPGSGCPNGRFEVGAYQPLPDYRGAASVKGTYVEKTIAIKFNSYVKDVADDGLDVYLWVRHSPAVAGGELVSKPIAKASGAGVSTPVAWVSPHEVTLFNVRVCLGEGETNCSRWIE